MRRSSAQTGARPLMSRSSRNWVIPMLRHVINSRSGSVTSSAAYTCDLIDNAHLLDQLALEWSLDLRTYFDERQGFLPRRALILVGQAKATELRNNRIVRMLAENDEACAAWTERLE